jgi:hypothetical protein
VNLSLSGRPLTAAALLLAAVAALAGGRYALRAAAHPAAAGEGERLSPAAVDAILGEARAAEGRGDVASALSAYRRAVEARPALLDRTSSAWLGAAFGERLNGWVAAMKAGTLRTAGRAGEDAAFLFRRLNGGCG